MALPKIQHPTLPILVPSLQKASRFRPFTVKEEKILLMAKESNEEVDHLRAVHQVVSNCSTDPGLDIDALATFDLEWLYLKIRSVSVAAIVKQAFNDTEEKLGGVNPLPVYEFDIDLEQVRAPEVPYSVTNGIHTITLESGDGVDLVYPPAILYTDPEFVKNAGDAVLYRSTKRIFTKDTSFVASESTQAEVIEYYDGWSAKDIELVKMFLDTIPSMQYECKYKNSYGHERTIKLTGLTDFFTF